MFSILKKGDFSKCYLYLTGRLNVLQRLHLKAVCDKGLKDLQEATPKDTGATAAAWSYDIDYAWGFGGVRISFKNDNIQDGTPIALILQYGHATRNGGWVEGHDYINPAIQPVFDRILQLAIEEVTKLV